MLYTIYRYILNYNITIGISTICIGTTYNYCTVYKQFTIIIIIDTQSYYYKTKYMAYGLRTINIAGYGFGTMLWDTNLKIMTSDLSIFKNLFMYFLIK